VDIIERTNSNNNYLQNQECLSTLALNQTMLALNQTMPALSRNSAVYVTLLVAPILTLTLFVLWHLIAIALSHALLCCRLNADFATKTDTGQNTALPLLTN
jgi:hypothetical protein